MSKRFCQRIGNNLVSIHSFGGCLAPACLPPRPEWCVAHVFWEKPLRKRPRTQCSAAATSKPPHLHL
eukprot:2726169-Amphidinium_carterae.1